MRVSDYFDAIADNFPTRLAAVDRDLRVDYATAQKYVHAVAHALRREPALEEGAHVTIYAPNDYRVSLLQLALNRAGMAWLSVHTRNSLEANIEILNHTDCELVFFHSYYESAVPALKEGLPLVKKFICIDRPSQFGEHLESWLGEDAAAGLLPSGPEEPLQTAMMQPTGGTTGPSKSVLHSQRSIEMMLISMFNTFRMGADTRLLSVAPLTHAAGLLALGAYASGGVNVVLQEFDVGAVFNAIADERVTHMFLPPTAIYALIADPRIQQTDLSSLQCVVVGGAPIAPSKFAEAIRLLGPVIYEAYGQTENTFPVLVKTPADYIGEDGELIESVVRSAGRAVPYARVEIMGDDGRLLPCGERGEIVVRSSMVMQGYYKRPEETAQVSQHGWHHSTDIGVKDDAGFVTIVDRKKDMIISGGFNIYPVEIEAVINSIPAVLDCAVVGVPDEKWGEAVKAVVMLKPGQTLSEEDVIGLCKQKVGSLKAPKSVEFWDNLPRSAVGKILKRSIREKFWAGQWRAI